MRIFRIYVVVITVMLFVFTVKAEIISEESGEIIPLDEVVREVISESPEMEMAEEDIEKAIREYKTAKTYYLPHLTLQGSAGVDLLHVEDFTDNNMGLNLILDWDFFRNGMLIYRVAQAKAKVVESGLNKIELENKITMETRKTVFDLIVAEEQLAIEKEELKREKEKLRKLVIQFEQGEKKRTEVSRFKATVFEKEQRFIKNKNEYEFNLFKFTRRSHIEDVEKIDYSQYQQTLFDQVTVELCQEIALAHVPRNKINKMTYELSVRGAKLARWKRWPQIELFAGNAFAIDDFGNDNNNFELRTGVVVRYPLYDGGEIKNQILLAELQEKRAHLAYTQGMDELRDKVREAYMNVVGTKSLVEVSSMQSDLLIEDQKTAEIEYEKGLISTFDYEEMLLNVRKSALRKRNAAFDFLKAYANLENTMGIKSLTLEIIEQARTPAEKDAQE